MQEKKKNNTKYWIIIILLIIFILLLLFFTRFGRIENKNLLTPTGNVDVFDIDINCNCISTNTDDETSKTCTTTDKNGNTKIIPTFNEITYKDVIGEVFVDDKNGNYIYQQNLKIFTNAAFEFTNKIAPGVSNTYHFVVHNSTDSKLKYYIEMYENTEYSINLKYRLKRNNTYVIGNDNNWVSANELKTEFSKINANTSDNYSLDWQWMYDDDKDSQDTLAGENMTSAYKLNIRFYFEQVAE